MVSELTTITGLQKVNFDLDVCNRILRVEAKDISPLEIQNLLLSKGFLYVKLK